MTEEVRHPRQEDLSQLKRVFAAVWLSDNRIYNALGVTEAELEPYTDSLLQRALLDPLSCAIGVEEDRIVSFYFGVDPFDDPIKSPPTLGWKMQTILRFNDELLRPLYENPMFAMLRQKGKLYYGLHGGTIRSHVGRMDAE